jgi:hypothetical protein
MKTSLKIFSILFFVSSITLAQVPKKVVVEHFTNTRCSVCASRNPGFYNNYKTQAGVIHLAIHPSSPYAACVLSQHNPVENDARTNYYGVYGGTPVLVIQGVVISTSANYGSSSIFSPFLGQTTPASIKIKQTNLGSDSIRTRVVVKTEASHNLPDLSLFVALAEDTLVYTGSNGEPVHYDVFRKSFTGAQGININLPASVGDSVVYIATSSTRSTWNLSRMYTLAILQEKANKAVVQSQKSAAVVTSQTTGLEDQSMTKSNFSAYVSQQGILVKQTSFVENNVITIYDISGRIFIQKVLAEKEETVPVTDLSNGVYLYVIKSKDGVLKTGKLLIN